MDFFEAIQLIRRRWLVILVAVLAGVAAGYVTAPGEAGADDVEYAATATLLVNPRSPVGVNLEQAALLATTGPVPEAVARELGLDGPDDARRGVSATADTETSSLQIRATRAEPERAEEVAAQFAEQLILALSSSDVSSYEDQVVSLQTTIQDLQQRVDELGAQAAPFGEDLPPVLDADLRSAQTQLTNTLNTLAQLQAQGAPEAALLVVEEGRAGQVGSDALAAPDGKVQRALLLAIFGVLLGVGGAFALDRLDTRIRTKALAEQAFGHPVIAEIPPIPRKRRESYELLALTQPASPFVESYRALRTVVALSSPTSPEWERRGGGGRVVLVTSAGAGEGKTTTVAHLAAMLAEVNRSVLVVSADFRRPRLHQFFDRERGPGLTDLLASDDDDVDLAKLIQTTGVHNVRLLPSGSPTENPAPLMGRTIELLEAARKVVDYVLVDTPPVLVANDANELISAADDVIVVARSGRTTIDAAARTAEIMERIGAPVLGTVLVAATDMPTAYSYYRYRYYSDDEDRGRFGRRRTGRSKRAATAPPAEPPTDAALEPSNA